MTILEMYEKASAIVIPDLVQETLTEQADVIITINQARLFNESEDTDGEPLEFYKSISYSIAKNEINPNPGFGRPDLYDTGSFYRDFNLTVTKDEFEVDSSDEKSNMLKNKYGDKIFGLSDSDLEMFSADFFNSILIEKIQKALS